MPTQADQWGNNQAVSAAPMPTRDPIPCLATPTVVWLADRPHARHVVSSVWETLLELERAGQHAGAIAALRRVLIYHQQRAAAAPAAGGHGAVGAFPASSGTRSAVSCSACLPAPARTNLQIRPS
jgi:hypothetical protein